MFSPVTLSSKTFLRFYHFTIAVLESDLGFDLKTCTLVLRKDLYRFFI